MSMKLLGKEVGFQ